jgi:anti-sigma factor RsiW
VTCREIEPLLAPFNDGELGTEKVLEVEQHVGGCGLCAERLRLIHAMRVSLRRVVQENAQPTPAFQARLAAALEAAHEREWEARVHEREAERNRMLSWRTILPVAAAAALTLVWAASKEPHQQATGGNYAKQAEANVVNVDAMLEDLVNHHVRGTPEITEPKLLSDYEDEVGVPVRVPSLVQYGAHWVGGNVIPIRNQRAAFLRYKLGNDRVTLYVYNASRVPFDNRAQIENRLQERRVGDERVYVGFRRGYSIGVTNRRGIGYAVASDLNDAETAEIVATLDRR